jgi:acyl dehydratase
MTSPRRAIRDRVQRIDGVAMAAYAGATWDWIQTHLDTAAARKAGFDRPIVDGQMLGALLAAHGQDAVGDSARVVALSFRHRAPVYQGDRVRIQGTVTSNDRGTVVIAQDMQVIDDNDEILRVAILDAQCTINAHG